MVWLIRELKNAHDDIMILGEMTSWSWWTKEFFNWILWLHMFAIYLVQFQKLKTNF
jgi:hypothetical protein